MNDHTYWYAGSSPTYHGTLGEIKPGVNRWPHLEHDVIMGYSLVEEAERGTGPPLPPAATEPAPPVSDALPVEPIEATPAEPTTPSVDSSPSTRRRGGRHLDPEVPKDESTED